MFYRSADFSNMAQSASTVIYLVFIGAVFSIVMEFIFSATWAWFVWLVVSIFLGTKKVRGPNFWGPNFSGTKFLGDQKSQEPK